MSDDWQVVEEALVRLYINVRAEYPFSVRDKELVESGLARLREREARLEQAKAHQTLLRLEAEARVAEAERERDDEIANRWKLEARVARLEEALREIASYDGFGYQGVEAARIARRALAHEEETPRPTFPLFSSESVAHEEEA